MFRRSGHSAEVPQSAINVVDFYPQPGPTFVPPPSNLRSIAMQSLAEECTFLKQRYDSCFNLWFEGYLQPALDHAARPKPPPIPAGAPISHAASTSSSASSSGSATSAPTSPLVETVVDVPVRPSRLITSWANSSVFRTRPPRVQASADDMIATEHTHYDTVAEQDEEDLPPLDTSGMTRAQAKAAEYERSCGRVWKEYQGCLRKAIAQNQNLTQLLDQARDEHPLHSMDGLQGTAWDPQHKPSE